MKKVIEIHDLTKNYGKSRGVSHVSFSVEQGGYLWLSRTKWCREIYHNPLHAWIDPI